MIIIIAFDTAVAEGFRDTLIAITRLTKNLRITSDLFVDDASINLFADVIVDISDEVVRSFRFKLSISNKFINFLTLNS